MDDQALNTQGTTEEPVTTKESESHHTPTEPQKASWNSPQFTAPLLMLVVFAAMHLSRYFLSSSESDNLLLSISIIQFLAMAFPCMLYYLLKKRKLATPVSVGPVRFRQIPLTFFSLLVFLIGCLLIKYLFLLASSQSVSMTGFFDLLYTVDENTSVGGMILSLIILPSFCEELLFRGVLFSEYRKLGDVNAVIITAVFFAILHFSVTDFPVYLFAGLLLGFVTAVSHSILPAILIHLVSNTMNLFTSDQFLKIIMSKNGSFFVGFLLTILFGIAVFLMLYSAEHLLYKYAEKPPVSSLPAKNLPNIARVFLSPSFLVLVAVFVLTTALT